MGFYIVYTQKRISFAGSGYVYDLDPYLQLDEVWYPVQANTASKAKSETCKMFQRVEMESGYALGHVYTDLHVRKATAEERAWIELAMASGKWNDVHNWLLAKVKEQAARDE